MNITESLINFLLANLKSWREITVTPTWKSELLLELSTEVIIFFLMACICLLVFSSFNQLHFPSLWPVNFLEGTETFHTLYNTQPSLPAVPAQDVRVKSRASKPDFFGLWAASEKTRGQMHPLQEYWGTMKGLLSWAVLQLHVVTTHQCYNYLIAKVCLKWEAKVCGKFSFLCKSL